MWSLTVVDECGVCEGSGIADGENVIVMVHYQKIILIAQATV